jgi:hypothetical protein
VFAPMARAAHRKSGTGHEQHVVALKIGADSGGHGLLPDRGMDRAEHQSLLLGIEPDLLEGADPDHLVVEIEKPRGIQVAADRAVATDAIAVDAHPSSSGLPCSPSRRRYSTKDHG